MVVDLGCGAKPFGDVIRTTADHYIGIDWSNSMHGLHADIVANLNGPLPMHDEVADMVVSFEVLEHLPEPGIMLAESFRILKPGGRLVLSVPFQWWVHEAPWDYYRYTRYGLEYLLRKAGFTSITVEATSGFWSMWILKLNYRLLRLVRGSSVRRQLNRVILVPMWWLGQRLALIMDRHRTDERETVGYIVTAARP